MVLGNLRCSYAPKRFRNVRENHSPLVREIYQFSLAMGVELMLIDCSSISPALDSLVNGSSDVDVTTSFKNCSFS